MIIFICVCIFVIVSHLLICDFLENQNSNQDIGELIENAIEDVGFNIQEKNINWEYLKSVNEDIIGWIEIEDTNINYPILKDNNLFYLKHSYNKKENKNGSIFTTNVNPFEDEETVIYGHNMKNGSMFSNLDKYLNRDFLNSHLNLKIYTPTKNYEGTIFSAYSIAIETETNNIKQLSFKERVEYYKKISKDNVDNIDNPTKIIKLSTCSYINAKTRPTNQRYYIIASIFPIK